MIRVTVEFIPKNKEKDKSIWARAEIFSYTTGIGSKSLNFGYRLYATAAKTKEMFVKEQGAFSMEKKDHGAWELVGAMLRDVEKQKAKALRLKEKR